MALATSAVFQSSPPVLARRFVPHGASSSDERGVDALRLRLDACDWLAICASVPRALSVYPFLSQYSLLASLPQRTRNAVPPPPHGARSTTFTCAASQLPWRCRALGAVCAGTTCSRVRCRWSDVGCPRVRTTQRLSCAVGTSTMWCGVVRCGGWIESRAVGAARYLEESRRSECKQTDSSLCFLASCTEQKPPPLLPVVCGHPDIARWRCNNGRWLMPISGRWRPETPTRLDLASRVVRAGVWRSRGPGGSHRTQLP
jgi:hypothetical protein